MGDEKVNHFAAQIVFVKEGLHDKGHFVPPDRADDDYFVVFFACGINLIALINIRLEMSGNVF